MQADTAMRRTANVLSFDAADAGEAAAYATAGYSGAPTWMERYEAAKRAQAAREAYDVAHRRGAAILGDAAGYGLAFLSGGAGAQRVVGRLSNSGKRDVGEAMSVLKTVIKGDIPVRFQARVPLRAGGRTHIDHGTLFGKKIVEAKYRTGRPATLEGQQKKAQAEFGDLYRFDRWGPMDVWRMGGGAGSGAALGVQAAHDRRGKR